MLGVMIEAEPSEDGLVLVAECNLPALTAFRACETQWRVAGTMAGLFWLGLDYAACRVVLDHLDAMPDVFDDLRVMEAAALTRLNEED